MCFPSLHACSQWQFNLLHVNSQSSCHLASHLFTSRCITSHHNISHHIVSYHTTTYHIMPCYMISYRVWSHHIISHAITPPYLQQWLQLSPLLYPNLNLLLHYLLQDVSLFSSITLFYTILIYLSIFTPLSMHPFLLFFLIPIYSMSFSRSSAGALLAAFSTSIRLRGAVISPDLHVHVTHILTDVSVPLRLDKIQVLQPLTGALIVRRIVCVYNCAKNCTLFALFY